ncbi:hypothetical protein LguiA_010238 [Lonicera macranthoides]
MAKRLKLTTSKLQKCSSRGEDDACLPDQIGELPDEILTNILSLLTLREAVRTSVVSRRWKNLWTFTTGSLDFDFGSYVLSQISDCMQFEILNQERAVYISRVNKILNSHQGATIDEFRVKFDLQLSARSDINSWINFALRKRVKRLQLNLEQLEVNLDNCYPFLAEAPSSQLGSNYNNISCLTSLDLNYVNVTGQVLKYLLSNCPFLEFVRILSSPGLVVIRIVDPLPKLKHLEVVRCHELEDLDISCAPNLKTLKYSGLRQTKLRLSNVPNLVDVSIGGCYCERMVRRFNRLPISLSQIEKLELILSTEMRPKFPKLFPKLKNVKQLDLQCYAIGPYSILSCASVIEACPKLYRFSMRLNWLPLPEDEQLVVQPTKKYRMKNKCLKVVELKKFCGSGTYVELATYLLSSAPFVEKIIADTRNSYVLGSTYCLFNVENVAAKECVRRLATQYSPTADLVIL